MLSMIEVQCPHCGVRGQMMVPPLGALIVGPCPNCTEFVVVFCGRVLPLDKRVLMEGSAEERHAHLMGILTEFLDERVQKVVDQISPEMAEGLHEYGIEPDEALPKTEALSDEGNEPVPVTSISQEEFEQFVHDDLPKLDNSVYFKTIFD